MAEMWLHLTAGQGPAECAWALAGIMPHLEQEARAAGIALEAIEITPGPQPGTMQSALVRVAGEAGLESFLTQWVGTIQWIGASPYRPRHKRKNWFVGVAPIEPAREVDFSAGELRWETMRSSGPGGQHVNRTESAVRVTHLPTGIVVTASEERSQIRNRSLALGRLRERIREVNEKQRGAVEASRWRTNLNLERGRAVRVFRAN
jgi:peptide chain release factor